jgi:hypothetical protein
VSWRRTLWHCRWIRSAAGGTETFGLDRHPLEGEAHAFGCGLQRVGDVVVFDFNDVAALRADQELGCVIMTGRMIVGPFVDAADKRRQPFHAVDEAVGHQKIQRPIDRGRRRRSAQRPEAVEQFVGAGGLRGVEDQTKYVTPQRGQFGAARGAACSSKAWVTGLKLFSMQILLKHFYRDDYTPFEEQEHEPSID